jgi:hypothetical protein
MIYSIEDLIWTNGLSKNCFLEMKRTFVVDICSILVISSRKTAVSCGFLVDVHFFCNQWNTCKSEQLRLITLLRLPIPVPHSTYKMQCSDRLDLDI